MQQLVKAQRKAVGRDGGLAAADKLGDVVAQPFGPVARLFGAAVRLVEKDERVGREIVRAAGHGVDQLHVLVGALQHDPGAELFRVGADRDGGLLRALARAAALIARRPAFKL